MGVRPIHVLHFDDNPYEIQSFKKAIGGEQNGFAMLVDSASSPDQFLDRLKAQPGPDLCVLDVHAGDGVKQSGITLARECKRLLPQTVIVMCSNMDTADIIKECLNAGADDFLSKRTDKSEIARRLFQVYAMASIRSGRMEAPHAKDRQNGSRAFVGSTMTKIAGRIPRILDAAVTTVHLSGESGTGKEAVADLLASFLPSGCPFIRVNCGAIAPTLLESELFGHVKGSFTGALADRRGLMEAANGGWIFMDEVATLSMPAQVALLRAIENQEVKPVGASNPKSIRVRVLSATNENMDALIAGGTFRNDLWQRLRDTIIELPPLRERRDEMEALILHFCKTMEGGPYRISVPAVETLCSLNWKKGNIRELRNCLRAMTEYHVDKLLTPMAIPSHFFRDQAPTTAPNLENRADEFDTLEDEAALPTPRPNASITLKLEVSNTYGFDNLSDRLLLEILRLVSRDLKRISVRGVSRVIGVSRTTLTERLRVLSQSHLLRDKELVEIISRLAP